MYPADTCWVPNMYQEYTRGKWDTIALTEITFWIGNQNRTFILSLCFTIATNKVLFNNKHYYYAYMQPLSSKSHHHLYHYKEQESHIRLFTAPQTIARQAPLSMGFSRQEYWSKLPFPTPGDFPSPKIKLAFLMSPALAGGFFITSATWEAPW